MNVVCRPTVDFRYGWGLYAWQAESPSGIVNRWHLWVANTSVGKKSPDRMSPFAQVVLTRRYECRLELLIQTRAGTADVVLRKIHPAAGPHRRIFLARPDRESGNGARYRTWSRYTTDDADSYVAGVRWNVPLSGVRDFFDNARASRAAKRAENLFDWLRECDWLLVPEMLAPTSVPVAWPDPPAPGDGGVYPPQP